MKTTRVVMRKVIFVLLASLCFTVPGRAQELETFNKDILHPGHFVKVSECPSRPGGCKDKKLRPIVWRDLTGKIQEYVNAEVDVNSKIFIEFDRQWIRDSTGSAFQADISIEGQIKGEKGVRNLEIPGYFVTGEELKVASARVRSSNELIGMLVELANLYDDRLLPNLAMKFGRPGISLTPATFELEMAKLRRGIQESEKSRLFKDLRTGLEDDIALNKEIIRLDSIDSQELANSIKVKQDSLGISGLTSEETERIEREKTDMEEEKEFIDQFILVLKGENEDLAKLQTDETSRFMLEQQSREEQLISYNSLRQIQ